MMCTLPKRIADQGSLPVRLAPVLAAVVMLVVSAPVTLAQTTPPASPEAAKPQVSAFQKDEVDVAIDKAIAFLVRQQKPTGSVNDKGYDTTMTSLAIMAMASVGVQPADPDQRGQAMKRALEFVLKDDRQDDKGYFGRKDGSRMYGHGITTLMLTEMLGMGTSDEQDELLHKRCLLYTSPSPRDKRQSRMPSSA